MKFDWKWGEFLGMDIWKESMGMTGRDPKCSKKKLPIDAEFGAFGLVRSHMHQHRLFTRD